MKIQMRQKDRSPRKRPRACFSLRRPQGRCHRPVRRAHESQSRPPHTTPNSACSAACRGALTKSLRTILKSDKGLSLSCVSVPLYDGKRGRCPTYGAIVNCNTESALTPCLCDNCTARSLMLATANCGSKFALLCSWHHSNSNQRYMSGL